MENSSAPMQRPSSQLRAGQAVLLMPGEELTAWACEQCYQLLRRCSRAANLSLKDRAEARHQADLHMNASDLLQVVNCAVTSWSSDARSKTLQLLCDHPPSPRETYRLLSDLLGVGERVACFVENGQLDDGPESAAALVEVYAFHGVGARLKTALGNLSKGEYEHLQSMLYTAVKKQGSIMFADWGVTKQRTLIAKAQRAGLLGATSALALNAAVSVSRYFPGSSHGVSKLMELLGFTPPPPLERRSIASRERRSSLRILDNARGTINAAPRVSRRGRKTVTEAASRADGKHRKSRAPGLTIGAHSSWDRATAEAERSLKLPRSSSGVEVEGWRKPSMILSRLYYAMQEIVLGDQSRPSPKMHPSRLRQRQQQVGVEPP
ncbi:hypothetical protein FOL46_009496 [Perkinsus olseni]|uniref:Uncharacterized protein n=1 Tax=Perkinsus olseni TaxID=32597 RepID=A0A7J6L017_PEROL|nr:hypothetical protein FOL46_009496 [Perkinsus olseni]